MKGAYKRELSRAFRGYAGWGFLLLTLGAFGAGVYLYNIGQLYGGLEYSVRLAAFALIAAAPLLTMDAYASSVRCGMSRLLRSLPVKARGVALGRFLAHATVAAASALLMGVEVLVLAGVSGLALSANLCMLLGYLLLALALIAAADFIACLAPNVWIAALGGVAALLLIQYLPTLAGFVEAGNARLTTALMMVAALLLGALLFRNLLGALCTAVAVELPFLLTGWIAGQQTAMSLQARAMNALSAFDRLNGFLNGVVDLRAALWLISCAALFGALTALAYGSSRYEIGGKRK